jgi:uncharacterized coiled-coil DUF342 family protein
VAGAEESEEGGAAVSPADQIAELERRLEETTKLAAEWHEQAENYREQAEAAHDEAQDAKAALVHAVNRCGNYDATFKKAVENRARRLAGPIAAEAKAKRDEADRQLRHWKECMKSYAVLSRSHDKLLCEIAALRAQLRPYAWTRLKAWMNGGAK